MAKPVGLPLTTYREFPPEEMLRRAREFAAEAARRRSIRTFSPRAVDGAVIAE